MVSSPSTAARAAKATNSMKAPRTRICAVVSWSRSSTAAIRVDRSRRSTTKAKPAASRANPPSSTSFVAVPVASPGVTGSPGAFAASARVSLAQQTERLTDAYLAAVLPLEEYQRRRLELEQREIEIAEKARQLEVSPGRHDELAGKVKKNEGL